MGMKIGAQADGRKRTKRQDSRCLERMGALLTADFQWPGSNQRGPHGSPTKTIDDSELPPDGRMPPCMLCCIVAHIKVSNCLEHSLAMGMDIAADTRWHLLGARDDHGSNLEEPTNSPWTKPQHY